MRQGLSMMLISLIPGLAATYFFVSRGRLAAALMRAETAQRQAAENQLRLLESQLEPHMLFNTLANLRVLIGMDPPRAQAMLDQLIAFLRATLSASRSGSHPLREEFARLQDYLALMKVRMGERLQPVFELPAELAELAIPPLLLQPLVENAIKHAAGAEDRGRRAAGQRAARGHATDSRSSRRRCGPGPVPARWHPLRPAPGARTAGHSLWRGRHAADCTGARLGYAGDHHAADDMNNPTALIAEDEPLLAANLKQELAKLWPELQIVAMAPAWPGRRRPGAGLAPGHLLPGHPHARHERPGSRRRAGGGLARGHALPAARLRHRLRPVRAAGLRAGGLRLRAEAGAAGAPGPDLPAPAGRARPAPARPAVGRRPVAPVDRRAGHAGHAAVEIAAGQPGQLDPDGAGGRGPLLRGGGQIRARADPGQGASGPHPAARADAATRRPALPGRSTAA